MKILHTLEFYSPSIGGMQEVVRQLSERLVGNGHEVTVATSNDSERHWTACKGVKVVGFSCSGNAVRGLTGDIEAYRNFVLDSDFDVVVCFAAQQWATDALLPVLDKIKAAKVFVPTGFSALYDPQYEDYFEMMPAWLRLFDMNVFLSESYRDIAFARTHGITNLTMIPNGAAKDEFLVEATVDIRAILGIPHGHLLVLHVGSHTGTKGHIEAIRIFEKAKIKNATFLIVANDFGGGCAKSCRSRERWSRYNPNWRFSGKRLLVKELSRPETIAAYQAADLMLFPSQLECSPLVLYEAMASKTPFLSTDVGNAAEIILWSGGGLLLPTAFDSRGVGCVDISAATGILEDSCRNRSKRKMLASAGFEAWHERFSWENISRQYEALYRDLSGEPSGNDGKLRAS